METGCTENREIKRKRNQSKGRATEMVKKWRLSAGSIKKIQ